MTEDFKNILSIMSEAMELAKKFADSNVSRYRIDKAVEFINAGIYDTELLDSLVMDHDSRHPVIIKDLPEETDVAYQNLYKEAIVSDYALSVLEACAKAGRSYDTIKRVIDMAVRTKRGECSFDLLSYAENEEWSDFWIITLANVTIHINVLMSRGIKIVDYITPEHSPRAFSTLCVRLMNNDAQSFDLEWYRDPYWRNRQVGVLVDLMLRNRNIDYADFVTPATPLPVLLGMDNENIIGKESYTKVMRAKWSNMTVKLEYAIQNNLPVSNYADWCSVYSDCMRRYGKDGDALADTIMREFHVDYPDEIEMYAEHNKAIGRPVGAVEWIRDHGASVLRELPDDEVWEIGRDSYYANN